MQWHVRPGGAEDLVESGPAPLPGREIQLSIAPEVLPPANLPQPFRLKDSIRNSSLASRRFLLRLWLSSRRLLQMTSDHCLNAR